MIDRGIGDGKGTGKTAHLAQRNGDIGVIAFTRPLKNQSNLFQPALNDIFGSEMAIDATSGGTPVGIHNGTDSAWWTGSVLAGTWDFVSATNPFAGSFCVECISNTNGDTALFSGATVDFGSYVGVSGQIRIEQWGSGVKAINLQFRLGGVDVGLPVNLENYIDTGIIGSYQGFIIPKGDFSIGSVDVDGLIVGKSRVSGVTPKFRFDDLQIEETGGAVQYIIEAPAGKKYLIKSLYISYVDNIDISLADNSAPNLSYNTLLGVAALPNGINYQILEDGKVASSVSTKTLGDNLKSGANVTSLICDGTNTCITLEVNFGGPLVLDSRYEDCLTITIQDDLTGLISFTALASGAIESVSAHRPEVREG